MGLFKKSPSDIEFDSFIERIKEKGFDVKVPDKKKIKERYGEIFYDLFLKSLDNLSFKRLLLIFDEKQEKASWFSNFADRIVVNWRYAPGTLFFNQAIQKADEEGQST